MKNIILKAEKDKIKLESRPNLSQILSLKGFISYFIYRNSLPGLRDLINFTFDTLQILIIFMFLGKYAFSGGVLGYFTILFISSFWNAVIYSMRQKTIELDTAKKLDLLPNYFVSLVSWSSLIWLAVVILFITFIGLGNNEAKTIFIGRLTLSAFQLYSSLYFLASYTILRIYIPLSLTFLNRLLSLGMSLLLVKYLGAWAFVLSFASESILSTLITIKYCNKALKIRGVTLYKDKIFDFSLKNRFWFLNDAPLLFVKRSLAFSLGNLQKLILIIFVNRAYHMYVLEFFAFYQLIQLFLLMPARISKSIYYDLTRLFSRGKVYTANIIIKYNLLIVLVFGLIAIYILSLVRTIPLPNRFYSLVFELDILDEWPKIYMLLFFTFGIVLLNRVLLISESLLILISSIILFEYIVLGYFIFVDPLFYQIGNPLMIFSFKGHISLFYFLTLVFVYLSGFWKKDSNILDMANKSELRKFLVNIKEFRQHSASVENDGYTFIMVVLSKKYSTDFGVKLFMELISDVVDLKVASRVSKSTLLVVIKNRSSETFKNIGINLISNLGVYSDSLIILDKKSNLREGINNRFLDKNVNSNNFVENMIHPKLFSSTNDIRLEYLDNQSSGLEIVEEIAKVKGLKYKIHYYGKLSSKNRKNEILKIFEQTKKSGFILMEYIILRKRYLGLIPIIENGELKCVVELETKDVAIVKELLRTTSLNEFYKTLSCVSSSY